MSFKKGNQYGKKPRYKDPKEIQEKVDAYFKEGEGKPLLDLEGQPVMDRWGNPIIYGSKPPTVTGLALALGFKTRQGLLRYQAKKEFEDVILEAKSRVEEFNEQQLFTRDGAKGAQFSLAHNFSGWQNEKPEEKTGPSVSIINDIPQGTVNVNTETAVFNPLQNPEEEATVTPETSGEENGEKNGGDSAG